MTGYTEIKSCRVTKEQDLVTVLDVGHQKLTGVFPRPDQEVGVGPLNLVWSPSSFLVQLKIPIFHLYKIFFYLTSKKSNLKFFICK